MKTNMCILSAIDFGDASLKALETAADMARAMGARLVVLNVRDTPADIIPLDDHGYAERCIRDLFNDRLNTVLCGPAGDSCLAPEVEVRDGVPADEIVNAAERLGADLIVMGTHGRRGLSRAVLGSVAEKVLRRAPCPVLTVRQGLPVKV